MFPSFFPHLANEYKYLSYRLSFSLIVTPLPPSGQRNISGEIFHQFPLFTTFHFVLSYFCSFGLVY